MMAAVAIVVLLACRDTQQSREATQDKKGEEITADVVRARKFELVDAAGEVVGGWEKEVLWLGNIGFGDRVDREPGFAVTIAKAPGAKSAGLRISMGNQVLKLDNYHNGMSIVMEADGKKVGSVSWSKKSGFELNPNKQQQDGGVEKDK